MGEIAEDMIDGTSCEQCGQYFKDPDHDDNRTYTHGYPVTCHECWSTMTKGEKKGHQRAIVETI